MELDTVICGDCLEVMRDMPDNSVDLVLTDPPYGITQCSWDSMADTKLWPFLSKLKSRGSLVLTCSQPFTSLLVSANIDYFKYDMVWDKGNVSGFLNARKMPLREHEDVLVFAKEKIGNFTYNPQITQGAMQKKGGKFKKHTELYGKYKPALTMNDTYYPTTLIYTGTVFRNDNVHPTQKPVALMEYLIKTYSNEGDTILDPFFGSGTTGVAAVRMGRHFIGIEINPDYCKIAEKRIKDERKKYALFPEEKT
jgi:site-specific DNA-methyltransferase (adenine-specific)